MNVELKSGQILSIICSKLDDLFFCVCSKVTSDTIKLSKLIL